MVGPLITKQNPKWWTGVAMALAQSSSPSKKGGSDAATISPEAATPELIVGVYGVISEEAERTTEHCGS